MADNEQVPPPAEAPEETPSEVAATPTAEEAPATTEEEAAPAETDAAASEEPEAAAEEGAEEAASEEAEREGDAAPTEEEPAAEAADAEAEAAPAEEEAPAATEPEAEEEAPAENPEPKPEPAAAKTEPMPVSSVMPSTVPNKRVPRLGKSLPPADAELDSIKAYLKKTSNTSGLNLYEHLTACVAQVLEQRPVDAVDHFEDISAQIKLARMRTAYNELPTGFQAAKMPNEMLDIAKVYTQLAQSDESDLAMDGEQGEVPDILDQAQLLEWAGVGFGQEETFRLFLAVKKLVTEKKLKSVRLFGKIMGTEKNYYIVESEPTAETPTGEDEGEEGDANAGGDGAQSETVADANAQDDENPAKGLQDNEELLALVSNLPKAKPVPEISNIKIPKEIGLGVNKYVYWVCNDAGQAWTRLPDVTPNHIQAARRICKQFTGNLSHKLNCYPTFDGTEADYLRAQIARIAAGTVISPAGYYSFDQEDDGDETDGSGMVVMNPEFEGTPNDGLLVPAAWCHHMSYILPQGRTTWVNPATVIAQSANSGDMDGEDGDGDMSDEENEEPTEIGGVPIEPETGPTMLSTIEQDEELSDNVPAWSIRPASLHLPLKNAPVVARCNRWPGSVTVGHRDKFVNIYVGNGLKWVGKQSFQVTPLPAIQKEYGVTEEENEETGQKEVVYPQDIIESNDPTVEEEKAFEEANREKEEDKESDEGSDEGSDDDDA